MVENFLTVGTQVLVLFILIGIGVICGKIRFFSPVTAKHLTNIVLYFVTPCVVIDAFHREFDPALLTNLGITALCAVCIHIFSVALAAAVFRDKDASRCCVLRFGTVFSNCGFMSIPLQAALLGSDGVFYGAVFVAIFNLVLWSYGVLVMSGDKKTLSPAKLLLNPGVVGVVAGFLLFVFSVKLPQVISAPVDYMASLNTPLPMLIIGFYLSRTNLKQALLDKRAFDKSGLIYGMGHAIYSHSDPRANILHGMVEKLAREKGRTEEYELYSMVERLGPQVISGERKMYKGVSANVDFYSGFVYHMLDLPLELYTPIFAMARIAGWSAHRLEELINMGKIIRPAYQYVGQHHPYRPMASRD